MTPTLTRMNANSVPTLTSSARTSIEVKDAISATSDADDRRDDVGRAEPRVHLRERRWQQAVTRHGEDHPALPEQQDHHDDDDADDRADRDEIGDACPAHGGERGRQRRGVGRVDLGVVLHPGEDERDAQYSTVQIAQRAEDADRHVALRVAGLLRGRRDHVEADEGEEDDRRTGDDAAPAEDRGSRPKRTSMSGTSRMPPSASGAGSRLRDERAVVVAARCRTRRPR